MTEITDLEAKIIKQIEYYFGDANLGRDKFLQEQRKLDDGWVSMETMLKFNRLKQISDSDEAITSAIKKSTLGLVEVSEDNKKIRRSTPMLEFSKEVAKEVDERTIYAKGFPADLKLDEALAFFEGFGAVDQVSMRKFKDKSFKGSCFVTFKGKEVAEKFMATEGLKYKEAGDLIKFYKTEYFKQKNEASVAKSAAKKVEKKKSETDKVKAKMVEGSVLRVEGLGKDMTRERLRKHFEEHGKVQWVDLDEEKNEGKIRFSEKDEAKVVLEKLKEGSEGGVVKIDEQEVTGHVLEGEEELAHWKVIVEGMKMKAQSMQQGHKRKASNRGSHRGKKQRR